jgi:type III secretion system YscD/HrpQ family protein
MDATDTATEDSVLTDALELRILHGPQAGSTLPMEQGQTYALGTADSCAVLLAGSQIEAEHAAFAVHEDGIQVMLLQGKVMTIDRSEVGTDEVIPLGTPMRMGRVTLTVDSVHSPWPEEDVLEEPAPPQPEPEPALDALQEQVAQEARDAELAAHQVSTPPLVKPVSRRTRIRSMMPALLLGTAATLLMGAAVAAWVTSEGGMQAAVKAVGMEPAGAMQSRRAAVSGSSANAVVSAASAAASAPVSPEAAANRVAERLAAVTAFTMKYSVAGETELNVQQGKLGALRIVGAAATPAMVASLINVARTELASAAPVEYAIVPRAELPARFESRLRAAGLAPKFKVLSRDPKLELQAVLTGPEVRAWEDMFREFTREYGSVLTVNAKVQLERDKVEGHIETVIAGAFPYVVTTDGRRVSPGGVIEGKTLVAIRDGELTFSDGLRVRYGQ